MPLKSFMPAGLAALALAVIPVNSPAQPAATAATNPLLQEWSGPYGGVPPWDKVSPELFKPAFLAAIDLQRKEIEAITSTTAPATFANTIEALQRAGRPLGRLDVLFGVMTSNRNTPEYQALDRELSPIFAAADDEITFNERLFARVAAVRDAMATAGLTPDQQRLAQRTYDGFVRQGAKLGAADKQQLSKHQPGARRRILGLRHEGPRRRRHVDHARHRGRSRRPAAGARLGLQGRGHRAQGLPASGSSSTPDRRSIRS